VIYFTKIGTKRKSSPLQTFTVGFGISPNRPHARLAGYTAGREFHPAPKIYLHLFNFNFILSLLSLFVNSFCEKFLIYFHKLITVPAFPSKASNALSKEVIIARLPTFEFANLTAALTLGNILPGAK